jgi:hypothetical protein
MAKQWTGLVNGFSGTVGEADTTDADGVVCAIRKGQLVAVHQDDELVYLACAAAGVADVPAVGVAAQNYSDGDEGFFYIEGCIREVDEMTVPGPVYLSDTPGEYSATAGNTSQIVGRSYPASKLVILHFQDVAENHTVGS